MIEITRALARQYRAVLRKSVLANEPRGPALVVLCQADRTGLTLACEQAGVGLRYHLEGGQRNASVCLPASVLADVEGRGNDKVLIEQATPARGRASWQEGPEKRVLEFDTPAPASLRWKISELPALKVVEPGFLAALAESARTAAREASRLSLSRVLLRGRDGSIVGTDGRQLLIHRGFALPWKDDVLIPALPAFACREIADAGAVRLGRSNDVVAIEVGNWTFTLQAEDAKRYPDVERVIPGTGSPCTRLRLHPADVSELLAKVPRLPGHDLENAPVTLDLSRPATVRVREESGGVVEVRLERSGLEGPAMMLVANRRYLLRALALGFTEVVAVQPDRPLLCRDDKRCYVWMPLDGATAIARPAHQARRNEPMSPNGKHPEGPNGAMPGPDHSEAIDPVTEAEALRLQLQEALNRTNRLLAALKQQRRQDRVVRSAVASLRRLQGLDR